MPRRRTQLWLAGLAVGILVGIGSLTAQKPAAPIDGASQFLFCFWNVENLFDDKDDKRREVDEEYDDPFAGDSKLRQLKLDRLSSILLKMNGGKGPDVIACVEVESVRAADLLKGTLNAKITDPKMKYTAVVMKNLDAGRHIAPCLISRVPVDQSRTRLRGSYLRILEAHLRLNGHELCVVASHWTSQISQTGGGVNTDTGRGKYAATIYDTFADLAKRNPNTDFLVCGDFNDTPESDSVTKVLGAFGDRKKVTPTASPPCLLDLMAGKPADKFGTHYYQRPMIYDQICVSAGMLDGQGWSCDPDSVRVVTEGLIRPGSTRRQPWRFGNPKPEVADDQRGFSDHFPVTVQLTVKPAVPKP